MADMKPRDVVKDTDGNHFIFLKSLNNGLAHVESVATRETFDIPLHELEPTDREVF